MALKDIAIATKIEGSDSIQFSIDNFGKIVRGKENLIQRLVKYILTSTESNLFHNNFGTGFFSLFGVIGVRNIETLKGAIPAMVSGMLQKIKQEQIDAEIEGKVFDNSEYVTDIELRSVEYDDIFSGWIIILDIYTKSNEVLTVRLP